MRWLGNGFIVVLPALRITFPIAYLGKLQSLTPWCLFQNPNRWYILYITQLYTNQDPNAVHICIYHGIRKLVFWLSWNPRIIPSHNSFTIYSQTTNSMAYLGTYIYIYMITYTNAPSWFKLLGIVFPIISVRENMAPWAPKCLAGAGSFPGHTLHLTHPDRPMV